MKIEPDKSGKNQNNLFIDGYKDLDRETVEWYLNLRLCLEIQAYQSLENDQGEQLIQKTVHKTESIALA
jgi:hypothetical protein